MAQNSPARLYFTSQSASKLNPLDIVYGVQTDFFPGFIMKYRHRLRSVFIPPVPRWSESINQHSMMFGWHNPPSLIDRGLNSLKEWENFKQEADLSRRKRKLVVSLQLKSPLALIMVTHDIAPFFSSCRHRSSMTRETIRGEVQTDSNLIEHLKPSGL